MTAIHESPEPATDVADSRRVLDAALELLAMGEDLLAGLSPETYAATVEVAFNGSIGGHYRHCLDHFTSLVRGAESGLVDYDHRDRDPRVEREPERALEGTRALRTEIARHGAARLDDPVRVRCEVSYERGGSPVTVSTLGRELAYGVAHGIHHFALIAVMARLQGIQLPAGFGVAPSTLAHQRRLAAGF